VQAHANWPGPILAAETYQIWFQQGRILSHFFHYFSKEVQFLWEKNQSNRKLSKKQKNKNNNV
jgi:hypothetical protein